MSFLGFGRQQPSSAEKIAAVEAEMKLMADMMNRYVSPSLSSTSIPTRG
jgi:import inner membrane translocase subunit TIM10